MTYVCSRCGTTNETGMILIEIDHRFLRAGQKKVDKLWVCQACHRRPDNELRRKLWTLVDQWRAEDHVEPGGYFADLLAEVLTYPAATEEDEQAVLLHFGKTTEQLADEAEAGYDINDQIALGPKDYG